MSMFTHVMVGTNDPERARAFYDATFAALGIAGMPGKLRRCSLEQFPAKALGEMHALAADVGTGLLPERQRFGIVAELDADFFQNEVGIALDELQCLFVEHFIFANLAGDIGKRGGRTAARARCSARGCAPAAASAFSLPGCLFCRLVHDQSSAKSPAPAG